jgi:replication factor A1
MQFHYALVDDLMTKEEFEKRVEEKMDACGDLVDEPTAAMMVVSELGRHHVKVSALSGKSSLFSFFCKVIGKRPPKEFDRKDGEKGLFAGIFAGDDTGTVPAGTLGRKSGGRTGYRARGCAGSDWDDMPGRSTRDITVMALRKAEIDIACTVQPGLAPEAPVVPGTGRSPGQAHRDRPAPGIHPAGRGGGGTCRGGYRGR